MAKQQKPGVEQREKPRSWKDIQISNRIAVAMILALVALIGLALFLRSGGIPSVPVNAPPSQLSPDADPEADAVETLPYTVRSFDGEGVKNPFASETLGDLRITGIVTNSNGRATAIIEAGNASYVISEGETIPDSAWGISDITAGGVVFSNGSTQKTVYLQGENSGAGVK